MSHARILIVDDEPLIRWSVGRTLQAEGFEVIEAGSAEEARNILAKERTSFDAVVLDHRLPDADGLVLLREIKALTGTPVIMVTAHSSIEHAVSAMREGAYHYAGKPFDVNDLANLVKSAIAQEHVLDDGGVSIPKGGVDWKKVEWSLIRQALRRCNGNRTHAAKLLNMNRDQVRYRIEKFAPEGSVE